MTAKEIQQYVYNFFYNKKLPRIVICSIMGNITGESSWNPDAIEKGSGIGFGLCQWSYGRRTTLEAYGTSLKHQCEFLWSELTGKNTSVTGASYQWIANPADSVDNGEGFYCSNADFLAGNGTIDFLTKAFCYCWERPAYATNHLTTTRIPSAKSFSSTMSYNSATKTIWLRTNRAESGNQFYNTSSAGGVSNCDTGSPMVSGYNVLCNCVGLAWGAFYETWYHNDLASYNAAGGFSSRVRGDGGTILTKCKTSSTFSKYVIDDPAKIPPKGGLIVWSGTANHVAYISDVSADGNTITIHQSSYGGANWKNSAINGVNGAWHTTTITRNNKGPNLWWYQISGYSGATCEGFVANPGVVAVENGGGNIPDPEPEVTKYGVYIGGKFYSAHIYNGTKWVKATPKIYNGTKWVNCSE